ncbi:putative inner membrane transporter yicL [Solibacillus isronensis B3W22]|uniref:Putative inner membrane transporter yicL n=1 Tax=Solibacillus isronensis B3W22 TaxID=1224748 RepID=K1KN96_9BACL|nr:DMT family transporter [Solibacillus isronensis]AMO85330.1 multidrug transporter [Solibacillus silvestris]EKB44016.1 putative inner membrane transporter yicL [Solibacillus isronensis B3W22]
MERLKGIAMIIVGSIFWGATGPMMEWLLQQTAMTAEFMLAVRLMIAGILILGIAAMQKKSIFSIWKNRNYSVQLLIFSVIGMVGLQFTFVKSIEVSNAIIATLLQFLAPIFIVIYTSVVGKVLPPRSQLIGIFGTLVGLFLLLTNGSVSGLLVSNEALVWGLLLGFTYAFYTLYPARLMAEVGVIIIIGWGMIIGGLMFSVAGQLWKTEQWLLLLDPVNVFLIIATGIFGSFAYILFLTSLKYISPVETSILSSFEPLTAMVISVVWLGATLYSWQYVGILLMLVFVVYLSIAGSEKALRMSK